MGGWLERGWRRDDDRDAQRILLLMAIVGFVLVLAWVWPVFLCFGGKGESSCGNAVSEIKVFYDGQGFRKQNIVCP